MELFSVTSDISVTSIFHSSIYTKHFLSLTRFACDAMLCCEINLERILEVYSAMH